VEKLTFKPENNMQNLADVGFHLTCCQVAKFFFFIFLSLYLSALKLAWQCSFHIGGALSDAHSPLHSIAHA
jgi:Kef-type K+ transport system membrane component KefB